MPSAELVRRADVIATPHIGGLTPKAIEHQALETVDQVAAILQGQIPEGAVNANRADRLRRLA
jgi:D-3-phosphoglycerate dehydrogenase